MGFIKGEIHFINFIDKIIKTSGINKEEFYSTQYYVENIFKKYNNVNHCTWDLKNNPSLLTKVKVQDFINEYFGKAHFLNSHEMMFSIDFLNKVYEYDFPGVYMFSTDEEILYIGSSKKLRNRIPSSLKQNTNARSNFNKKIYLSIIKTNSEIDARLLELYWIAMLKPTNNIYGITLDNLTLEVLNPPKFNDNPSILVESIPFGSGC